MFDKKAVEAIQQSASIQQANQAVIASQETRHIVALPDSYKLSDLEKYQPHRRRARGAMETSDMDSFVQYTKSHAEHGATVFITPEVMRAKAVLNLGTSTEPGHADNTAILELITTAPYKALIGFAERKQSQKEVAEFMEDWGDHFSCFTEDGEVELKRAIAAVRKISIESIRKLENEEQSLSASRSAFENVTASSKEPIPTLIYFRCKPYADLEERVFVMRLSVLTGDEKPSLILRIIKLEEHKQAMANELAEKIGAEIAHEDPSIAIYTGEYSPG